MLSLFFLFLVEDGTFILVSFVPSLVYISSPFPEQKMMNGAPHEPVKGLGMIRPHVQL